MKTRKLENACPDCGSDMILKNSKFGLFYGCSCWPRCESTHGAHSDGTPLGVPADKETRQARIEAHEMFDKMWKESIRPKSARSAAYKWLRNQLNISEEDCHIGKFDIDTCRKVIEICKKTLTCNKCNAGPDDPCDAGLHG